MLRSQGNKITQAQLILIYGPGHEFVTGEVTDVDHQLVKNSKYSVERYSSLRRRVRDFTQSKSLNSEARDGESGGYAVWRKSRFP